MSFSPTGIRYIRLGEGGCYESFCIDGDGSTRTKWIRLSDPFRDKPGLHDRCLIGDDEDWSEVLKMCSNRHEGNFRSAHAELQQIQDFYSLPRTTAWFTLTRGLLWWCFADESVSRLSDGSLVRRTNGWSCTSLDGKILRIDTLDGRVAPACNVEASICRTMLPDYLLNRIRGEEQPDVRDAKAALDQVHQCAAQLIKGLWSQEFKHFVELILVRCGWRRIVALAESEIDIDIAMSSVVSNKSALVRVKAQAEYRELESSIKMFCDARRSETQQYDELYFIVCEADSLTLSYSKENVTVLGLGELAKRGVSMGLMEWLLEKRS